MNNILKITSMKKYILLLSLVANYTFAQDCGQTASDNDFQQFYEQVAIQNDDQSKLNHSYPFLNGKCYQSGHIQLIAHLYLSEDSKLEFCKAAYPFVLDKENFYDVYDAFNTFSYAFRLHDFVSAYNGGTIVTGTNSTTNNNSVSPISYPNYNYPSPYGYSGSTGCAAPISDVEFNVLSSTLNSYATDDEKIVAGTLYAKENCLSMAQLMKMSSLFTNENKAKSFLENAFPFSYDKANYTFVSQCFSNQSLKDSWSTYCAGLLVPATTCSVSESELKGMIEKIDDAAFAKDQLSVVKSLNTNFCFSTAQVKLIMNEFSFPENKLDVAEMLYEKCTDRKNYYQLKGEFSFNSYEEQFSTLIGD